MIPEGYESSNHSEGCYKQTIFHNHDAEDGCVVFVSNCILMPGGVIHPHVHEDMDECFIFHDESLLFNCGTTHCWTNNGNDPLHFVCVGIRRSVV